MFDSDKKSNSNGANVWGGDVARTASNWMQAGTQAAGNVGNWATDSIAAATAGMGLGGADMSALFGNFADATKPAGGGTVKPANKTANKAPQAAAKPAEAAKPAAKPTPEKAAQDLKTGYKNNPMAQRSLDALTGDKSYKDLTPEQKNGLLTQFKSAPNAATTNYLRGLAEYEKEKAADKSGDPEKEKLRQAKLENAKNPDSGSFKLNGTDYSIKDGKLLDNKGLEAGSIDNLGNYKMTGDKESSSYYDNLNARVKLQEGQGKDQKTLLDLHDTDPNGRLTGPNFNDTFRDKVHGTMRAMRKEGMDMGVAPDGGYRTFEAQDEIYKQGRSKPGKQVTNARGGESYHNYGVAADLAFYNKDGNIGWPEKGDYAKLWTRYGELAKKEGLTWGGDWKKGTDRPHVEYHPGLTSREAGNLKAAHRRGGLEGAWDQMGIGQRP